MRRVFVFIIASIYLVTSTGLTMHMHFCMGELADWSVWSKQEKKACGKCGMKKEKKPNGCCQDDQKWMKIENDQKVDSKSDQLLPFQLSQPVNFFSYDFTPGFISIDQPLPNSHAPPNELAIYMRNCVFLI